MASSEPRHNSEPWNDPKTCADAGRALPKRSVTELLTVHPQGLTKGAVGRAVCLLPNRGVRAEEYLCWAVLRILVAEGTVHFSGDRYRMAVSR
jgi:hypothetical protein